MSHQAPPITLTADAVSFGYPRSAPVLRDCDLLVTPRQRLALLGSNGSGKTTLLKLLSGALQPDDGRVLRNGEPVGYSRAGLTAHRGAVQLVLQDPADQLFSASVFQDISFGPLNQGLDDAAARARVGHAMDLLAIEHLADRPTHQLSYGEAKRVAIAGAIAMSPSVLLLDEPTAGLDPQAVDDMLLALDGLHEHGTTIVLSTHDVDLALQWADQVGLVLDGGVQTGDPVTLLRDQMLLAKCRLRRPVILDVAARLAEQGRLRPGPLPTDTESLLRVLD